MSNRLLFILLFVCLGMLPSRAMGASTDIDRYFLTQREFSSAVLTSLGDAGVALPDGASMGWSNPALLYSSCKGRCTGSFSPGYGRDSIFDRHIVPLTFTYVDGQGALGGGYRFMSGNSGLSQQEFALNFSGQLFDKVDAQGSVDMGLTVRYATLVDKRNERRMLPVDVMMVDTTGTAVPLRTIDSLEARYQGDGKSRVLVADLGFYQPDIMERLDFGLVLSNLFGYRWEEERPVVMYTDSIMRDTVVATDTLAIVKRTPSYENSTKKSTSWLPGRYRTLTFGVAYRTGTEAFLLTFPFDLALMGLFDKNVENTFVFRGGVAARLNSALTLRLGYAREPATIFEGITSFKNVNVFTGGAGITIGTSTFDCYFSNGSFGVTAEYRY